VDEKFWKKKLIYVCQEGVLDGIDRNFRAYQHNNGHHLFEDIDSPSPLRMALHNGDKVSFDLELTKHIAVFLKNKIIN
jgi:hypothetical protein